MKVKELMAILEEENPEMEILIQYTDKDRCGDTIVVLEGFENDLSYKETVAFGYWRGNAKRAFEYGQHRILDMTLNPIDFTRRYTNIENAYKIEEAIIIDTL